MLLSEPEHPSGLGGGEWRRAPSRLRWELWRFGVVELWSYFVLKASKVPGGELWLGERVKAACLKDLLTTLLDPHLASLIFLFL